ncbi:MAG: glycerol acyltransferase [Bacteroidetes bacterium]|nr:glycerol acyltransferase [Bacteroidota bacterium]
MEDLKITERTIDLENVFRNKNPRLAAWIPGFIFAFLRKIVHEKEINDFLFQNQKLTGLDFVEAIIKNFRAILEVRGIENIPLSGRFILVSNHPLGALDGVALMHVIGKTRKDIVFPVNDLLMYLPNLNELFIPINKHGSNSENIDLIRNTFASEKLILYFPAGLVSRKQKSEIKDLDWKKTFVTRAIQFNRDIIPVFIEGKNSDFFYKLANIRKMLRIKANIEMVFLPDEMYKQKDKKIRITIGKPIAVGIFDKKFSHAEWALKMKEYIYTEGKSEFSRPFTP